MATMDIEYVFGNAHHATLLNCRRKNTNSVERDKLCVWNSCDIDDAFEAK